MVVWLQSPFRCEKPVNYVSEKQDRVSAHESQTSFAASHASKSIGRDYIRDQMATH